MSTEISEKEERKEMKSAANVDVKKVLHNRGIVYWQVADKLGIAESTLIRWMRKEMDPEKKAAIYKAVDVLIEEREVMG